MRIVVSGLIISASLIALHLDNVIGATIQLKAMFISAPFLSNRSYGVS
ncbi:hypothetical protein SynA1825c_02524 [Synechococcus sp. A18-25c]|nr:hypothetical protein SynA1825c_02524 [Synechococcus sp. A18-25c]